MKAQIIRLPAQLTLEETEAMGGKGFRHMLFARNIHNANGWTLLHGSTKNHTVLTKEKVATTTNDTGFALLMQLLLKVLFL